MCGILGTWHNDFPINYRSHFSKALDLLIKRGPDDKDLFIEQVEDGTVSFGHRRLSIIDLTSGGHQPMHSFDKRYSIIFNGMIYNYKELRVELENLGIKFISNSDTEVLVHGYKEWGLLGLVKRLDGMFAFGLWDTKKQKFLLARDRVGIKPLYFCSHQDTFRFASEIKIANSYRVLIAVYIGNIRLIDNIQI